MSASTVSFITNENALTVINAYLIAIENTSFEEQHRLITAVLNAYKPQEAAQITGLPLQKIYHYRRKDLKERVSSIPLKDLVRILTLGNLIS